MIFLKSIGAFFTKIWRWIKETAWVQPLLIVGAIFAVIFSIPYITEWAQSWSGNATNSFYTSNQLTINGETSLDEGDSNTAADQLTNSLYTNSVVNYSEKGKPTDISFDTTTYGTKFFVVYIDSDASSSTNMESGFKFLSDHWNDSSYGLIANDDSNYGFKMYTIFTDEDSDNDDKYEYILGGASAFYRYLDIHSPFFNAIGEDLMDAPYYTNERLDDTNYNSLMLTSTSSTSDPRASFPIPTILLVDYSPKAIAQGRAGVSEVLFSLDGDNQTEQAKNLMYMWNHTNSYSEDRNNPFVDKSTNA